MGSSSAESRGTPRRIHALVLSLAVAVSAAAAVPAAAGARGAHARDTDRDGLTDAYEVHRSHTNPRRRDTDGDRLADGAEVKRYHTNPRRRDTDGDGLADGAEVKRYHTNPRRADTDGDGTSDGQEVKLGRNPRVPDRAAAPSTTPAPSPAPAPAPAHADALVAPDTTIASGPTGTVATRSATFVFSASQPLSAFECRLDDWEWTACSSPQSYTGLANGDHVFAVRAVSGLTGPDPSPATWTWTVDAPPVTDTTPPATTIDSGPDPKSLRASATFAFHASERGSTFECRLDTADWAPCESPVTYAELTDGAHSFSARAIDRAGNADPAPPSWTWMVDTAPARDTDCMPDPSVCGFPDVETTGTLPGIARDTVVGTVHLDTPGQVYENKTVTGDIVVTAANVTIRNVKLIETDQDYGIRSFAGSGVDNLLVTDSEIDMNGNFGAKGIAFDEYTLRRVFIHDGSDCAHMGANVSIEDSLCVVGPDADGDAWPDSVSFCSGPDHLDGFQTDGGYNLVIHHDTIRNPCDQTSNIALFDDMGETSRATVDDNLLAGGGYTVYCPGDHGFEASISITNNHFARTWFPQSGHWGPLSGCQNAGTVAGNVWDDSGAPVGG